MGIQLTLLLVYLFLALFVSFICSIMEAALLSTPLSYLRVKQDEGQKYATKFLAFKKNIDKPLSAILSLNTIAHTVGAAGVGAQATQVFGEAYFGIVSAVLTILILVLTEIIPKTLGTNYAKSLSPFVASVVTGMIYLTYPIVYLSGKFTKLFSGSHSAQTVSREEIAILAHIGTEEGTFGEKENRIIQNLLMLRLLTAKDVMTPRVVVATANENMLLSEFLSNKSFLRFSRIPVFMGNDDHITGYVFRHKVFECIAEKSDDLQLKDIKRNIIITNANAKLIDIWDTMLRKQEHIALIVDEWGGMDGIITMEDIIESLIGIEIIDEKDTIPDMQAFAKQRWESRQAKYKVLEK